MTTTSSTSKSFPSTTSSQSTVITSNQSQKSNTSARKRLPQLQQTQYPSKATGSKVAIPIGNKNANSKPGLSFEAQLRKGPDPEEDGPLYAKFAAKDGTNFTPNNFDLRSEDPPENNLLEQARLLYQTTQEGLEVSLEDVPPLQQRSDARREEPRDDGALKPDSRPPQSPRAGSQRTETAIQSNTERGTSPRTTVNLDSLIKDFKEVVDIESKISVAESKKEKIDDDTGGFPAYSSDGGKEYSDLEKEIDELRIQKQAANNKKNQAINHLEPEQRREISELIESKFELENDLASVKTLIAEARQSSDYIPYFSDGDTSNQSPRLDRLIERENEVKLELQTKNVQLESIFDT